MTFPLFSSSLGNYRDRGLTTDELVRTAGILVFEYRAHESSDEKVPRDYEPRQLMTDLATATVANSCLPPADRDRSFAVKLANRIFKKSPDNVTCRIERPFPPLTQSVCLCMYVCLRFCSAIIL